MWLFFHNYCIFFESKSNLIFLVDPVTQSHKGLKQNATQQAGTITEARADVFGVIGKGLVTSSLFPQDTFSNCTLILFQLLSDFLFWFVFFCLLLFGFFVLFCFSSWMPQILCFLPTVKQLIVNSKQAHNVGLDYSGDRRTVCHSFLFGKTDLSQI